MKQTLITLLALTFLFPSVSWADNCRTSRQNFSHSYYAPQYAEVYYFIGQPLRIKALMEIELAEKEAELKRKYSKEAPPEPEIPAARISLVTQVCAKCHSGATPKAQMSITSDTFLTLDNFKAARNAVLSGEMPKGQKLTDEEKNQVISELSTLLGE